MEEYNFTIEEEATKQYELLLPSEREQLPKVLLRRQKFKRLISQSVLLGSSTFSNCMLITGKPGTGKTTMVTEYLDQLKGNGDIADYHRYSGHITQSSLFNILKDSAEMIDGKVQVLVLDDVDCLFDSGCIELMKAAFDTKNNKQRDNRKVFYLTHGTKQSFRYDGYAIIITNHPLDQPTDSQNALIDRVHLMRADLDRDDFRIFNINLMEQFMNQNPDSLSRQQLDGLKSFFDMYIRAWFENDIFQEANVYFSIRLLKKFIDLVTIFGPKDWLDYSVPFKKLHSTYVKLMHKAEYES